MIMFIFVLVVEFLIYFRLYSIFLFRILIEIVVIWFFIGFFFSWFLVIRWVKVLVSVMFVLVIEVVCVLLLV